MSLDICNQILNCTGVQGPQGPPGASLFVYYYLAFNLITLDTGSFALYKNATFTPKDHGLVASGPTPALSVLLSRDVNISRLAVWAQATINEFAAPGPGTINATITLYSSDALTSPTVFSPAAATATTAVVSYTGNGEFRTLETNLVPLATTIKAGEFMAAHIALEKSATLSSSSRLSLSVAVEV